MSALCAHCLAKLDCGLAVSSPSFPSPPPSSVMSNFQLLERRHRNNKDGHVGLQDKLLRSERTKNCLDTELNSLKPEIKMMQAERGRLYR